MQLGSNQVKVSRELLARVLERTADEAFVALFEARFGMSAPVEALRRGPDRGNAIDPSSADGVAIAYFILFVYAFDRYIDDRVAEHPGRPDHGPFSVPLVSACGDTTEEPTCN